MSDTIRANNHNIILESRKSLRISGVKDIDVFTENKVVLNTVMGELVIKGDDLHISTLTVENGDFMMTGNISAMVYSTYPTTDNVFKKLFR